MSQDKIYNDALKSWNEVLKGWGITRPTADLIFAARDIVKQYDIPLTLRQLYYRLVANQTLENTLNNYKKLSRVIAIAREKGLIPYDKIEDRTRRAIIDSSWTSPSEFFKTVKTAYRRDLLIDQGVYLEVWVEKDALAGVFEVVTRYYGVPLVVGRGYPSHSAIYEASKRIGRKDCHILYFGDFDPSGEDIYRDVQDRLGKLFEMFPESEKVALTLDQISQYQLPPAPAKKSDSRYSNFVANNGDLAVELDALPPDTLQAMIKEAIESRTDLKKFESQLEQQERDQKQIERLVSDIKLK